MSVDTARSSRSSFSDYVPNSNEWTRKFARGKRPMPSPIRGPVADIQPAAYYNRVARHGKTMARLLDSTQSTNMTTGVDMSASKRLLQYDAGKGV